RRGRELGVKEPAIPREAAAAGRRRLVNPRAEAAANARERAREPELPRRAGRVDRHGVNALRRAEPVQKPFGPLEGIEDLELRVALGVRLAQRSRHLVREALRAGRGIDYDGQSPPDAPSARPLPTASPGRARRPRRARSAAGSAGP